ncbi:MAG: hypothetical protein ABSF82_02075 [Candidatus Bathyarchaeia archaeon]
MTEKELETCISCLGALGHWHIVGTTGYLEECADCGGTGKVVRPTTPTEKVPTSGLSVRRVEGLDAWF